MVELCVGIAVGLSLAGLNSHIQHPQSLRSAFENLGLTKQVQILTTLVIAVELTLCVTGLYIALAGASNSTLIFGVGIAGSLTGLIFASWIIWLLTSARDQHCGCSYSQTPVQWLSLIRPAGIALFSVLLLPNIMWQSHMLLRLSATAVGVALGIGVFILPDALSWPDVHKAMLTRLKTYEYISDSDQRTRTYK